jgi:arylsulfatase A-like enzyme
LITIAAWLAVAVCWSCFGLGAMRAESAQRPNIVIFLADDLGWADVPWHGSQAKMPNLDKLMRESVRLEAHYVHPMCSPTRAALMTGRFASRFGVTGAQNPRALRWGTQTLASALKSAGYETAITGKWHLGSRPEEGPQKFGFDHGYGSLAGGCGPFNHRYKEGPFTYTWHRDSKLIEEEGHVTDLLAREAVAWLDQRTGEKPFFLYVPFTAIHVPIQEPQKWLTMNDHLADDAQRLRAACSSHMDDTIGQVLAVLDRKKFRDNTLIVFFGDNGAHAPQDNQGGPYPGDYGHLMIGNTNAPLRGHKSSIYEGGIRTPGLASWSGKLKPGETHSPIHAVDWLPTLARLAGAKLGDVKLDGTDIWPALAEPGKPLPPRTIYTAAPGWRGQAVRHGDWKLIVHSANGKKKNANGDQVELYNLASDQSEANNLAAQQPEILAQMKQRLAEISRTDKDAVAND